jgi:putative transposase
MARLARAVVAAYPHHVTQRGNRRQPTFFSDDDYKAYADLMTECCRKHGVSVWAWCLMPNHVHLVVVPETAEALARAFGEAHRRYTRLINFREGWRGYLWQGRFASYPMDSRYALAAARYVERNPVRAGLVRQAWAWPWSSAAAHVAGGGDGLIAPGGPLVAEVSDWRRFLAAADDAQEAALLRRHARTGRPLGSLDFVLQMESVLGRRLRRLRPGPRPKRPSRRAIK